MRSRIVLGDIDGGSVGLALLSSIAATAAAANVGQPAGVSAVHGYATAFGVAAAIFLGAAIVTGTPIRTRHAPRTPARQAIDVVPAEDEPVRRLTQRPGWLLAGPAESAAVLRGLRAGRRAEPIEHGPQDGLEIARIALGRGQMGRADLPGRSQRLPVSGEEVT